MGTLSSPLPESKSRSQTPSVHEVPGLQSVSNTQAKAGLEVRQRIVTTIRLRMVGSHQNLLKSHHQMSEFGQAKALHSIRPSPQILQNVGYKNGQPLDDVGVERAINDGKIRLGKSGRLVIRPSGADPLFG